MPQPETPTARVTEESRPVTEPTDLTGARTTMLLALRLGGVNREDAESVLADYDATVREQVARDIETIAAAAAKSLLPRPRVERGEFMNDWEWAAAVARTPQRAAVSAPATEKANRPVSLGTACACGHARNWHDGGACTVGICTCREFTAR